MIVIPSDIKFQSMILLMVIYTLFRGFKVAPTCISFIGQSFNFIVSTKLCAYRFLFGLILQITTLAGEHVSLIFRSRNARDAPDFLKPGLTFVTVVICPKAAH
jgi:hypothetical protein